jgi:phosphate:Na+ symporter
MNSAISAWAGLGLFFIGMRLLGSHLQQLGGGPLRALLARTLNRPLVPQIAGFISGALTQSTSAVTFIAAGLVSAAVTTVLGALPLLAWANVGTSVLVLLAAIDMRTVVFFLLGAIGCAFFAGMEQRERYRNLLLALLGVALLLFGLSLLKGSVAELRANAWVHEFFEFTGTGAAIGLLVGFVIATAVQSSSIVTVLALPLVHEGLLDLSQVTLLIYGASLGSGFAVLLLASGMEGPGRHLAICQAGLRALAAVFMLPLFFLERDGGVPLVMAVAQRLADSPATQCGLIYLAFQLAVSLVAGVGGGWLAMLAARWSPPPEIDAASRPAYLFDEGTEDPETALELARLEYRRLLSFLPEYLDALRPAEERAPDTLPFAQRVSASTSIAEEISRFLNATLHANPGMSGIERVFAARAALGGLQALQDNLAEFVSEVATVPASERPSLVNHMVEGLHALLTVAADGLSGADPDAIEMLQILTEERGSLMDDVRKELVGGAQSLAGREALVSATLLFERLLWMLRRLARTAPGSSLASGMSGQAAAVAATA